MRKILMAVLVSIFIHNAASAQPSSTKATCGANKLGVSRVLDLSKAGLTNIGDFDFDKAPLEPYEVILTFDDGPNPKTTPKILEALEQQCTKATFFETGQHMEQYPQISNMVADAGNTVGMHSYKHDSMKKLPKEAQIEDFHKVHEVGRKFLGNKLSNFYRFPFLDTSKKLTSYMNNEGIHVISVDVDSFDWTGKATTKSIVKHVLKNLKKEHNSGIILMHDVEPAEAEALPVVLENLKSHGYKVVAIR